MIALNIDITSTSKKSFNQFKKKNLTLTIVYFEVFIIVEVAYNGTFLTKLVNRNEIASNFFFIIS